MTKTISLKLRVATEDPFERLELGGTEDDVATFVFYDPIKDAFLLQDIAVEALLKTGFAAIEEAAAEAEEHTAPSFGQTIFDTLGIKPETLEHFTSYGTEYIEEDLPDGLDWSAYAQDSEEGTSKLEAAAGTALVGTGLIVLGGVVTAAGAALGPVTGGASTVAGAKLGTDLGIMGGGFLVISFLVVTDQVKVGDNDLPQDGDPAHGRIDVEYVKTGIDELDPLDHSEVMLTDPTDEFVFISVDIEKEEDDLDALVLKDPEGEIVALYVADFSHLDVAYGLIDPPRDPDDTESPIIPEPPEPSDSDAFFLG
ncbi:MAG: hypothetical protein AAGH83_02130 [Pseudomonadota bacterium]